MITYTCHKESAHGQATAACCNKVNGDEFKSGCDVEGEKHTAFASCCKDDHGCTGPIAN